VTSPTGAALRDVLHCVQRRHAALEIIFVPSAVQGAAAASEIAAALNLLNQWSAQSAAKLDAILLTRGGGSLEDLWSFNEEIVARAIVKSEVPVVSAVGHEIDFTISDFVADVRAATPTAGAEILTEGVYAGARWIPEAVERMDDAARRRIAVERRHGSQVLARLRAAHPRRQLNQRLQQLDDLREALLRAWEGQIGDRQQKTQNLVMRLANLRPRRLLKERREHITRQGGRLRELALQRMRELRHQREALAGRLRLLGPEQVLGRGYSITMDTDGKIIRSATEVRGGQKIKTRLKSGEIGSKVSPVKKAPEKPS
jgi:exodeoxyribonuclease VII large subunit